MSRTDDVRIGGIKPLIPPACVHEELPESEEVSRLVLSTREEVARILRGEDDRLIVVVGPCSIHDTKAAMEYAQTLLKLKEELATDLLILMRVYFEKPRTTIGWKGLINDPDLDCTFKINKGLRVARKLLLDLNQMGVPAACEFLDTISPQYICDLVSWGAIGARTTESQCHRELASGVSCPVGFKNGTSGNVQVAVDGVRAAKHPHRFLGVTKQGIAGIVETGGNPSCHVILRGGMDGPNYEAESVQAAAAVMEKAGMRPCIMVDCSHGNSLKDHKRQPMVAESISAQVSGGQKAIVGVMIESNICEGKQSLPSANGDAAGPSVDPLERLTYGQSITDACIDLAATETVLRQLAQAVSARRSA